MIKLLLKKKCIDCIYYFGSLMNYLDESCKTAKYYINSDDDIEIFLNILRKIISFQINYKNNIVIELDMDNRYQFTKYFIKLINISENNDLLRCVLQRSFVHKLDEKFMYILYKYELMDKYITLVDINNTTFLKSISRKINKTKNKPIDSNPVFDVSHGSSKNFYKEFFHLLFEKYPQLSVQKRNLREGEYWNYTKNYGCFEEIILPCKFFLKLGPSEPQSEDEIEKTNFELNIDNIDDLFVGPNILYNLEIFNQFIKYFQIL